MSSPSDPAPLLAPARYWAISEPGPGVTHVVDSVGYIWARTDNPRSDPWVTQRGGVLVSRTWMALLINNGPLVDATGGEWAA